MTVLLQGGKVVDPTQGIEKQADLLIRGGKIAGIGKIKPMKSWKIVDVKEKTVVPGLIDMHVHLREPGREDKETIETGCRAAVAGGFTSVACMANTDPVNDCEAITRFIVNRAREVGLANIFPVGAVTKGLQGKELAEIGEMVRAGAVAVSDDGRPVQNNQIMRRVLEYSKIFGIPVLDHCEDLDLAARGVMNESTVSTQLGLRGINNAAEELHVVRDMILSRLTGARVHICHISARESIEWVREAKARDLAVTCEATPHHFVLNDENVRSFDTHFKMHPPLRTQEDVEAVLQALADGTIDCIVTDHAPHTRLEKEVTFEEAANGIIGLETSVPLVVEFLLRKEVIGLSRMVELMSVNPARILGIDRGTLEEGAVADVTILDLERAVTIRADTFQSKSRNCPFDGWELHGASVMTIVGGRMVWQAEG